jgi:hypothetical protein
MTKRVVVSVALLIGLSLQSLAVEVPPPEFLTAEEKYRKAVNFFAIDYHGHEKLTRAFLGLTPNERQAVFDEYVSVMLSIRCSFSSSVVERYPGANGFLELCRYLGDGHPDPRHPWSDYVEKAATIQDYMESVVAAFAALTTGERAKVQEELFRTLFRLLTHLNEPPQDLAICELAATLAAALTGKF